MNRTKDIEEITNRIIENLMLECEMNDKLVRFKDYGGLENIITERSEIIREHYIENEELYGRLREYIAGPIDDELANALFESARAFLLRGRHDPAIICEVAEPVIDYYRRKGEDTKAIILSAIRNACMGDYFNRMDAEYKTDMLLESFDYLISKSDMYTSYEDLRARENILLAYKQKILFRIIELKPESLFDAFDLIEQVNKLWNRPEVQALDGDRESTKEIMDSINYTAPLEINVDRQSSPIAVNKVIKLLQRYCDDHVNKKDWSDQFLLKILEVRKLEVAGNISARGAIETYTSILDMLPESCWTSPETSTVDHLILFAYDYMYAMQAMKNSDIPSDERHAYIDELIKIFHRIVKGMPYEYLTSYINDMYKNLFLVTVPNLTDFESFEKLLHELMFYRQPSTYLHSQMVERIAVRIAEDIYAKEPEHFIGIPGYASVEDVKAKKDELFEMIKRSACLHDLGKCCITAVITRQSRRITEEEFECIRKHPEQGIEFFEYMKDADVYKHVILGHHKSYDGKSGYPDNFDNVRSPYRFIIDLISICDSTDAATDIIGRNYTKGKTFAKLLEELKEGAGTRYNPDIVRIIADSPELIADLTEFTGEKRIDYCYEAYTRCINRA